MRTEQLGTSGPSTITTDEGDWWETERRRLLVDAVRLRTPMGSHLDMGCGRGSIAEAIAESGRFTVAVDAHLFPEWAGVRGVSFVVASAECLPFRDGVFASTSAFDVIEHLPDDAAALAELRRVTSPQGATAVSVPAFAALWSTHDETVGHHRRYDRSSLSARLLSAGYRVAWSSYFFTFLVPPAWLLRHRSARSGLPDGRLARLVAPLISALCALERLAVRHRRLPFGTSLVAVTARSRSGAPDG